MKHKVARKFAEYKAAYWNSTQSIQGRAVTFPGMDLEEFRFFIYRHSDTNLWNLCEVSTGCKVSGGSTITEAVGQFVSHLERHGGVETLRKLVSEVEKVS